MSDIERLANILKESKPVEIHVFGEGKKLPDLSTRENPYNADRMAELEGDAVPFAAAPRLIKRKGPKSVMSCELWSINRILRWTGFRLYIEVDARIGEIAYFAKPTRIGIQFWGWSFLRESN